MAALLPLQAQAERASQLGQLVMVDLACGLGLPLLMLHALFLLGLAH